MTVTAGHLLGTPDLEGLPEAERPILARALAKRPEDRWPDCTAMIGALRALGTADGLSVPETLLRPARPVATISGLRGSSGVGESPRVRRHPWIRSRPWDRRRGSGADFEVSLEHIEAYPRAMTRPRRPAGRRSPYFGGRRPADFVTRDSPGSWPPGRGRRRDGRPLLAATEARCRRGNSASPRIHALATCPGRARDGRPPRAGEITHEVCDRVGVRSPVAEYPAAHDRDSTVRGPPVADPIPARSTDPGPPPRGPRRLAIEPARSAKRCRRGRLVRRRAGASRRRGHRGGGRPPPDLLPCHRASGPSISRAMRPGSRTGSCPGRGRPHRPSSCRAR